MKKTFSRRILSAFLAVLLCFTCIGSPAVFAADNQPPITSASEPAPVEADTAEKAEDESNEDNIADAAGEDETSESSAEDANDRNDPEDVPPAALSDATQAFADAVGAIDREAVLHAASVWGLAHKAWLEDQENTELKAALDAAVAESDEAAAALYAAEDMFYDLSEDEQENEVVQAAYLSLMSLIVAMQQAMDDPTEPGISDTEGGDEPPSGDEIAAILYGDLPDAPMDYYMGSYGLPVAVGETKIGIGEWNLDDTMSGCYMDAAALNSDGMTISVPLLEGEDYAIVPIMAQVEYPANGSSSRIVLPDGVVLLSQDSSGRAAATGETARILNSTYAESSAAASGILVQAMDDFTAQFVYEAPDGTKLEKSLIVHLDKGAAAADAVLYGVRSKSAAFAERPTPSVTSGKITQVQQINGTWLIWFNGEPAYCCDHGLTGKVDGCPTYSYSHTSIVEAAQYTPGDHYANQVNIWGGLNQLTLGFLNGDTTAFATRSEDENAAACYDDVQRWIMANYPDSVAAQAYRTALDALASGITTYASDTDVYAYIFQPPVGGWQNVAVIGPATDGSEEPDAAPQYYASWNAPAQTVSGSFDFNYTVNTDKQQLITKEKVDGAIIEIEPVTKSGTIDGGSWAISPADKQAVTTSGHTMDENFQNNGGDASASWSLRYEVSKTSGTRSGSVGPYSSQEEANSAAASARDSAINELRGEAQRMVDTAIASAKNQLANLKFRYQETGVPYGFELFAGELGSHQTITVPANVSKDYVMLNDEWSLQVFIRKTDSETGNQIASDAEFAVFEWDVVTGQYIPYSANGYNQYTVEHQPDGTYSVINHSPYAASDEQTHILYYTQRNEGKFVLVEATAPSGYFGDWTDIDHPGIAGTPLGKRGYYIEITAANDGSVIWLDNTDYSADIATSYTGGTRLLTAEGIEATITVYKASDAPAAEVQYQDAARTYNTDNSGTAANEDSYTMQPREGVLQNDRVLGEISLSKVDLDAVRYVGGRDAHGDAMTSGQAHADASLEGAIYDLYVASDIQHPDGVSGVVDYSKITDADGSPVWHTTIRDNAGQWVSDYLPVLAKDHLVASAQIKGGWLTFSNLYLGDYYIVERGTGVVIPVKDGALVLSGSYPAIDAKTKQPTGETRSLAVDAQGRYTQYVYMNQWSNIAEGKAFDGTRTYDGYYESYAKGYLCDEHNYYISPSYTNEGWYVEKTAFEDNRQAKGEQRDTTAYSANYHIHRGNTLAESADQVAKGNLEISKHISSTGSSSGTDLAGAGFTVYLISDLSKAGEFNTAHSGSFALSSILDAYINPTYDESNPKYDFSAEEQAIAKTYADADEIAAYNASLTAAEDNRNGSSAGWLPTGRVNEYQLSEVFSNDSGTLRIEGLPYGQYLVVETTTPADHWQAEPFILTVDPTDDRNPQSKMAHPKGTALEASGSYQKYTILDEEVEAYLRVAKIDAETGKPVLLAGTAFQIYWLDEQGNHVLDKNGSAKLVTMTDTTNGSLSKTVDTFYTNSEGVLTLPEKLPIGRYRLVEISGPNGFYNEWADTAAYDENGRLQMDDTGAFADGKGYVDFIISTDRIYNATGDDSEDAQDILVIDERYSNNETLGQLKIRKTGEVLVDYLDGRFIYEERPLANAEFTITAAEDIYTQDRQVDSNGNRTLWYAKGDVVAVVRTGDGTHRVATFAPGRTQATYDFLTVTHNEVGEVTVTLPLGRYLVSETGCPYGFTGTEQSYEVSFVWNDQTNGTVLAKEIVGHSPDGTDSTAVFTIVDVTAAGTTLIEQQVLGFYNEREKAGVKVVKLDSKTDEPLAGAVFGLFASDDIYSVDGKLLVRAGEQIAVSAPSDEQGIALFDIDLPIRGELFGISNGKNANTNSGDYFSQELASPSGYYLNDEQMPVSFIYDSQPTQQLEATCKNDGTSVLISKRKLTGSDELPGATLRILDKDGKVIKEWISGEEPKEIRGLELDTPYTLVEVTAPNGFAIAESIRFKLVQRLDEDGNPLNENDVYICTGKDWLIIDRWELAEDGTVIMRDAPTPEQPGKPGKSTPTPEPTTPAPQTGDTAHPVLLASLLGAALLTLSVLVWRWSKRRHKS
ncbi:MAG: SpaA isopeptide-forming pilin-related protein [Roseburia sp.]|nr:SpaA isopeptide-forming pilin-related protein [Roseburia sp.]